MGQYYHIVNIEKKQYIDPHKFYDGGKLLEFGCASNGTMTALAILLADGNGRGGGDLRSDDPIIGSWAGNKIVITGDYADGGKFINKGEMKKLYKRYLEEQKERDLGQEVKDSYAGLDSNLYSLSHYFFEDISEKVIKAMKDDSYVKQEFEEKEQKLKFLLGNNR